MDPLKEEFAHAAHDTDMIELAEWGMDNYQSDLDIREMNKKIVAVSGGFDPIHIGHVRMFQEAKKLGDELVVILNNDNWLSDKKGAPFMKEEERKEIIEAIQGVDRVVITDHSLGDSDRSVCRALREIKPHVFANGGDRHPDGDPVPEVALCNELGIEMVYNAGVGGKVQSSSWLIKKAANVSPDTKTSENKLHTTTGSV